jgi:hypothetical protein
MITENVQIALVATMVPTITMTLAWLSNRRAAAKTQQMTTEAAQNVTDMTREQNVQISEIHSAVNGNFTAQLTKIAALESQVVILNHQLQDAFRAMAESANVRAAEVGKRGAGS